MLHRQRFLQQFNVIYILFCIAFETREEEADDGVVHVEGVVFVVPLINSILEISS